MNHLISSKFDYKIQPMGKPRQVASDRWKKRPEVLRYRAFADEIRLAAAAQNFFLGSRCIMIFEFAMAPSWSKGKKEKMNGKPHQQRPDLDNAEKSVFDIMLNEDSSVYTAFCAKFWAYEGRIRIYNVHATKDISLDSLIEKIESEDSPVIRDWF